MKRDMDLIRDLLLAVEQAPSLNGHGLKAAKDLIPASEVRSEGDIAYNANLGNNLLG